MKNKKTKIEDISHLLVMFLSYAVHVSSRILLSILYLVNSYLIVENTISLSFPNFWGAEIFLK